MPQFDLSVFPSQLFWFAVCFLTLLLTSQFLILPRIKSIILNRNKITDADLSTAAELNQEIESLKSRIETIKSESSKHYQALVEEAVKSSKSMVDDEIARLRLDLSKSTKTSRQKIAQFLTQSSVESNVVINRIISNLQNKILN